MNAGSAFRKQTQQATKTQGALRIVTVPPSVFASSWSDRPRGPVQIGLRLLSEDDVQTARGEAARSAWAFHREEADQDNRIDAFNDALMRHLVGRGTCRPNDISEPWFEMADDTVRLWLTSDGARFLWNEIEKLHVEESPLQHEADDEDLELLASKFAEGALEKLPADRARRARRLLAHVLAELE